MRIFRDVFLQISSFFTSLCTKTSNIIRTFETSHTWFGEEPSEWQFPYHFPVFPISIQELSATLSNADLYRSN